MIPFKLLRALLWFGTVSAGLSAPFQNAFNYQGRILDSGVAATGVYDLRFTLYDAASAGTQIGSDLLIEDVPVSSGLFNAQLDFGPDAFGPESRWLQMGIRPGTSTGGFIDLPMRQALIPVPQAQFALVAGSVTDGGVTAGQIAPNAVTTEKIADGAVTAAKIGTGQVVKSLNGLRDNVTLSAGANITLQANGNQLQIEASTASHTHSAAEIGSGTLNDARLSSNVSLLDRAAQSFTGNTYFMPSSGGVGIGTTTPGELLEVFGPEATVRIKDSSDLLGGFMGQADGIVQFGLYNNTQVNNLPILPFAKRSFLAMDPYGAVGTVEGNFGEIASAEDFRITLDDGTGRMRFPARTQQMLNLLGDGFAIGVQNNTLYDRSSGGFAWFRGGTHVDTELDPGAGGTKLMSLSAEGNLDFNNMPGLHFAQHKRGSGDRQIVGEGQEQLVDEISIRCPAAGFVYVTAFMTGFGNGSYQFILYDVSDAANPVTLVQAYTYMTQDIVSISWVVPVSSSRYLNLKTTCSTGEDDGNPTTGTTRYVEDHNLTAIYFPVRYQ